MTSQEEDPVLKQLEKLKVEVTIWQLIVASQKHRQLVIDKMSKIDCFLKLRLRK